jgi:hypothetical protein
MGIAPVSTTTIEVKSPIPTLALPLKGRGKQCPPPVNKRIG